MAAQNPVDILQALDQEFAIYFGGATPAAISALLSGQAGANMDVATRTRLGAYAVIAAGIKRTVVEQSLTSAANIGIAQWLRQHMWIAGGGAQGMNAPGHYNWNMLSLLGHMILHYNRPTAAGVTPLVAKLRGRMGPGAISIWTNYGDLVDRVSVTGIPNQFDIWVAKAQANAAGDVVAVANDMLAFFNGTGLIQT